MRRIFYDTETTGVRTDKDLIIEIAAFDPERGQSFESFINPKVPIPPEASAIHKITDDMVQDAPDFETVGREFLEFCGEEACLIAHNNDRFDKLILGSEGARNGIEWPKSWIHLDSLLWARRYRPDLPRHSLQFLREHFQIEANNAHRALDDVVILHKVFDILVGDLSTEKIIELMLAPKKMTHMPFGKHRGSLISEVPKNYVAWLAKSGALEKSENEELKEAFSGAGLL